LILTLTLTIFQVTMKNRKKEISKQNDTKI
jgi:hypothetical protein